MSWNPNDVAELFEHALELPTETERDRWLALQCSGRPELLQRVRRLLRASEKAASFLEQPAVAMPPSPNEQDAGKQQSIPRLDREQIGNYKLLQEIGHGGMGLVYLAEQLTQWLDK